MLALDQDTAKSIEHGRRIRASLRQPESSPLPVAEQIILLLALTSGLFDTIALAKMSAAKNALRGIINRLPAELSTRLATSGSLSDEDHQNIIALSKQALASIEDSNAPLLADGSEQP